jgi:polyphenol oxidase
MGPPAVAPGPATFARREGLAVLTWPSLAACGVEAVVTTRAGGVSTGPYRSLNLGLHVGDDPASVLENRARAAAALRAGLDDVVVGAQVHGAKAAEVGVADRGRGAREGADALPGVDALVTAEPGVVLVTLVADCVPLVLVDPRARVLACVHAGWRGTAARVVDAALAAMAGLGARPADVVAALGPAVGAERYQVGPEVAAGLRQALGRAAAAVLVGDGPDHWRADLVAANRLLLETAGVPPGRIVTAGLATGPGTPFFSDRAERPCGRFALMATLRPDRGTARLRGARSMDDDRPGEERP